MNRPLERNLAALELDWVGVSVGSTRGLALPALEEPARVTTGGADSRTVGAEVMRRYAYPAIVAGILYARERRVPDLAGAALLPGRVVFDGGFSCLEDDGDAASARVVPDLRAELAAAVAAYLEPAIQPLHERTRLGHRALWGVGASAVLVSLAWDLAERGSPEEGKAEADALAESSPVLGRTPPAFDVVDGKLVIKEGVCCRAYRWNPSPGRCSTCPVLSDEERLEQQLGAERGLAAV